MMSFSAEWEKKFGKKVYAENKSTKEVYECNPQMSIANIQSVYTVSKERAEAALIMSSIDNPIELPDCVMWVESFELSLARELARIVSDVKNG